MTGATATEYSGGLSAANHSFLRLACSSCTSAPPGTAGACAGRSCGAASPGTTDVPASPLLRFESPEGPRTQSMRDLPRS